MHIENNFILWLCNGRWKCVLHFLLHCDGSLVWKIFVFSIQYVRCNVCKMYITFKFIQPVRRSDYKQQSWSKFEYFQQSQIVNARHSSGNCVDGWFLNIPTSIQLLLYDCINILWHTVNSAISSLYGAFKVAANPEDIGKGTSVTLNTSKNSFAETPSLDWQRI